MKTHFLQRLGIVLIACLTARIALAQSFDVKGIALGSTLAELKDHLGAELSCDHPAAGFESPQLPQRQTVCSLRGSRIDLSHFFKQETFAGQDTIIFYHVVEGHVAMITFANIRPEKFDETVATMETKYGVPKMSASVMQNRMGATFQQKTAVWNFGNDVIIYKKYGETLDYSSPLQFFSHDTWAEIERKSAARDDAAKKDM